MKKNERLLRLYELLSEAAAQEREFTIHEAIKRIGYKKSTIKTYLSKKLHSYVNQSASNSDSYRIAAPLPKSEEAFLSLMTQRAKAPPTKEENLAASLLERSRDAFTGNRPADLVLEHLSPSPA
ncbi:hypothetical protein FIV42_05460 [Persicimonas caeni]|uniref:Uncharacterized protein n=1 Tax=Persicimonas caeni TaxID=2292766 RepID=A0A4Y6PQY2_PERCE|nr:hypothetical protein [Persicimonas caeni]QDG50195.1 hypothetical protein FIV42_05460 [Persicimonas caeni]QED31416.1 hypothetical protein FRD00_05455 [Persicimonas caeni]